MIGSAWQDSNIRPLRRVYTVAAAEVDCHAGSARRTNQNTAPRSCCAAAVKYNFRRVGAARRGVCIKTARRVDQARQNQKITLPYSVASDLHAMAERAARLTALGHGSCELTFVSINKTTHDRVSRHLLLGASIILPERGRELFPRSPRWVGVAGPTQSCG